MSAWSGNNGGGGGDILIFVIRTGTPAWDEIVLVLCGYISEVKHDSPILSAVTLKILLFYFKTTDFCNN